MLLLCHHLMRPAGFDRPLESCEVCREAVALIGRQIINFVAVQLPRGFRKATYALRETF
jgi:hypothetical protein